MVKNNKYPHFTRNEFCNELEYLTNKIDELNKYVTKLESVIKIYKEKDSDGKITAMLKENLACKTQLAEKDKKIEQMVYELLDASDEIEKLEKELKNARLTITQYEIMHFSDKGEIKQIKN